MKVVPVVAVGRKVDGQEIVDDAANVSGDPLGELPPWSIGVHHNRDLPAGEELWKRCSVADL